jgi:hypothetical protein
MSIEMQELYKRFGERYAADPVQTGDLVLLKPRRLRVFLQDHPQSEPLIHWNGDGI